MRRGTEVGSEVTTCRVKSYNVEGIVKKVKKSARILGVKEWF